MVLVWCWYRQLRTHAGVCIGLNAGVISIVTKWLSDIKMGYCADGWWLNQQFCCWEIEVEEEEVCHVWQNWSTVAPGRWFVYVLFAVGLICISRWIVSDPFQL